MRSILLISAIAILTSAVGFCVTPIDFSDDVYIVTEDLKLGANKLDEPWSAILIGGPDDSFSSGRVIRLYDEPSIDSDIFVEFDGHSYAYVLDGVSKWRMRTGEDDSWPRKWWVYDCWLLLDFQGSKKWCKDFVLSGSTNRPFEDYIYSRSYAPGIFDYIINPRSFAPGLLESNAMGYVLMDRPSEESELAGYFPYSDTSGIERHEIDSTLHVDYLYKIEARTEEWLYITANNPQRGWIKSDISDKCIYQLAFVWPLPVPGTYDAAFYLPTTEYVDQILITVYSSKRYSEDNIFINRSLKINRINGYVSEAIPEFVREDKGGLMSTYFYQAVFDETIPKNEIANIVFVCGENREFNEKYGGGRMQIEIDFSEIWASK